MDLTPVPLGGDIQVNESGAVGERWASISPLSNGGFVVTWTVINSSGFGGRDVLSRIFDAGGHPIGPVNIFPDATDSLWSSVSPLGDHGFVITRSEFTQLSQVYDIVAQRYALDGAPVGSPFVVNSTKSADQHFASVDSFADGGFVVVWASNIQDGSGFGVYGQRFAADGTSIAGEFKVSTTNSGDQIYPDIATFDDGSFAVVWTSPDSSGTGIFLQRFDATGDRIGGEEQVNFYTAGAQQDASITSLEGGGFVVTWTSIGQVSSRDVIAQVYDASGQKLGSEVLVNTFTNVDQELPSVTSLRDGGFLIAWSALFQDGSGFGVYGQRFDDDGSKLGTEFRLNAITNGNQIGDTFYGSDTIAELADGRLVAVWTGVGTEEVFVRLIDVPRANTAPTDILLNNQGIIEETDGATIGTLTAVDPDAGDTASFAIVSGANSPRSASATINFVNGGSANRVIDGIVPPEQSGWPDSGAGWQIIPTPAAGTETAPITISLGGTFKVDDLLLSVDNNDEYRIEYSTDGGSSYRILTTVLPGMGEQIGGMETLSTISGHAEYEAGLDFNSVFATHVRIFASGGDGIYAVGELQAIGTALGTSSIFEIADGNQLRLRPGVSFDAETDGPQSVTIMALDSAGGVTQKEFTLAIDDLDEFNVTAPVDSDAAENRVTENAAIGTVVGLTAFASDADATTNAVTYSLTSNPGGLFAIDAATGVVTVAANIDREAVGPGVNIEVTATSADGSSAAQTFAIEIENENDNAPVGTVQNFTTAEDTPVSGTLVATDADGDTITYFLSGAVGGVVTAFDQQTSDFTFVPDENFNGTAEVQYVAYDGQQGIFAGASILVTPVNDAPVVQIAPSVQLVSRTPGGASPAGYFGSFVDSYPTAISADGRIVTFYSTSSDLVPGDTNSTYDAFLFDTTTGETRLISQTPSGTSANGESFPSAISADGRLVTFYSVASDLVPVDTNGTYDVFLYDTATGTVSLVSRTPDGAAGNNFSVPTAISADGRLVTFYSIASDLVPGDTTGTQDAFLYDTTTGETRLISRTPGGIAGNSSSNPTAISADGRFITLRSFASDLVPGDTNGTWDAFLYDTATGETRLISQTPSGTSANGESFPIAISADGRFVTFFSSASNLVPGDANGGAPDAFLFDTSTGEVRLISQTSEGTSGNGTSAPTAISADGRFVAFYSSASDIVPGDTNFTEDAFLYDTNTGEIRRISQTAGGTAGDGQSVPTAMSSDGRFVTFVSSAGDLVPGDRPFTQDAFIFDRLAETGPLAYTENTPPTPIAPSLVVADIDSATLAGATVAISANYATGQDVLAFIEQSGITGSFDEATGVLTLTGTASVLAYQAALRSVTYFNASDNPSAATRTVSVQVDDGSAEYNLSAPVTREIIVTPFNDAPTVAAPITASVTEDNGIQIVDLLAGASDAEADTLHVADLTDLVAGLSLVNDTIEIDTAAFQSLGAGVEQTISLGYDITDGNGGTVAQTAAITITGLNDAPQLTATDVSGAVTEDGAATLVDSGSIAFADTDAGTEIRSFVALKSTATSGPSIQPGLAAALGSAVTLTQTGAGAGTIDWSFALDNSLAQYLAEGETVTATYTITADDQSGTGTAVATQDMTVTITGTNDAPRITGATGLQTMGPYAGFSPLGYLAGMLSADGSPVTLSATFTFEDVDLSDAHYVADRLLSDLSFFGGTSKLSALDVSPTDVPTAVVVTDSTGSGQGVVQWSVVIDQSFETSAGSIEIPWAAAGKDQVYLAYVADFFLSDRPNVFDTDYTRIPDTIVAVFGVNDVATIAGNATGSVTEDGTLTAGGMLTVSDVDRGENRFRTADDAALAGAFGDFTFNSETGDWTFTLNNALLAVQALPASDVRHQTLTVASIDGTATKDITVTITGTNDSATITGTAGGAVTEDGELRASGRLVVSDIDSFQRRFQNVSFDALRPGLGTFTFDALAGDWTFTLNNALLAVQSLTDTDVRHQTLTVTTIDGTATADIVVTVTGTNDAATIAGTATGSVTEDGTLSAGGTLIVSDVDMGENRFQAVAPSALATAYGAFSFDELSGDWNYLLSNTAAAVQSLKAGQVVHDTLTVASLDGTATSDITVTITGANDAAKIGGTGTGFVFEDLASFALGTLTITDADLGEGRFQAVDPAALSGVYGTFTFDENSGAWTYLLDDTLASVQSLPNGEGRTEWLTVTSLDGTAAQMIEVVVTGTNDAATIAGTASGAVTEDGTLTASGTLSVSDVDTGENRFQAVAPAALVGTFGTFSFNAVSGAWSYALNNAAASVQALNTGDVRTDTLTVTSLDGTATRGITVTINGTNEPVVVISNGNGNGILSGTAGADIFRPDGGTDIVRPSNGNDTIIATVGDGNDIYDGGAGVDVVDYSAISAGLTIELGGTARSAQTGTDVLLSIENIIGGSGADRITGNSAANRFEGFGGNDRLEGGGGDDTLIGGAGNDRLEGGAGNDMLDGGADVDTLDGGAGVDRLEGGDGADTLDGGASNDVLEGGAGSDVMIGGSGSDRFVLMPGFGNDRITDFDANPSGGQDFLDIRGLGITSTLFASRVTIADVGADTLVTIDGVNSIRLTGIGNAATVTIDDFRLL